MSNCLYLDAVLFCCVFVSPENPRPSRRSAASGPPDSALDCSATDQTRIYMTCRCYQTQTLVLKGTHWFSYCHLSLPNYTTLDADHKQSHNGTAFAVINNMLCKVLVRYVSPCDISPCHWSSKS